MARASRPFAAARSNASDQAKRRPAAAARFGHRQDPAGVANEFPPHLAQGVLGLGALLSVLAGSAALAQPATPPGDFAVCSACHESTPKAGPSLGPNLFGIGGRKAGTAPDYDYSPALKAYGATWTAETLQAFILDPAKAVPGNKMDYPGASDAAAAKAIADYLMTLKG